MKLYLLRHASAADIAPSDAARELTAEGREEARIVGAALAKLGVIPARVFVSPLLRARQTAELAAHTLGFSGTIESADELLNHASTEAVLRMLGRCGDASEVLLVGHMPSLAEHLAALIGAKDADGLPFGKAGIACVRLDRIRMGSGQLRWKLGQNQLRVLAAGPVP